MIAPVWPWAVDVDGEQTKLELHSIILPGARVIEIILKFFPGGNNSNFNLCGNS